MADITMCRNEECKIKDECYRYIAPKDIPCSYFWDNTGYIDGREIGKWWKND